MARNSFALSWHGVAASALLLLSAHGAIAANLETAGKVPPGSRLIITGDGENADQFRVSTEQEIPDFRASAELPEFEVVPGAYIVSLRSGARLAGRRDFSDAHASFQRRAASVDINYQIREEYRDAELFYGLSLTLEDEDDVDALKDLPEVENVWPVTVIQAPKPFGFEKFDIGGPVASEYGYNTSVTRGENYKIDYNLKLAGVDHMHNNGFKGQGVKLAVLDSGVDYRHPSLGGGFGPGKKITFGRSYVNDGTGGPNDPLSTCTDGGHGTHVAGTIIAEDAKDKGFGLLGVAPDVELGMYRVFSCAGDTTTDVIIRAILDAVEDGAEILSLSIGALSGWEINNPFEDVVTSLKAKNILLIAANGNNGADGPYFTAAPAISSDAIAVASVDAVRYPTTYTVKDNKGGSFRYGGLWPVTASLNVYVPPVDVEGCLESTYNEALAYVTEMGWEPENTALLFKFTNRCQATAKSYYGKLFGFQHVINWKSETFENPSDNLHGFVLAPFFSLYLDANDGPKVIAAAKADPEGYKLQFSDTRFKPVEIGSAGFTSNFSTYGATFELNHLKPDIAAPGHLILSTWPLESGGYAILSGTSMATPFVAGCYALLKSAHPDLTVDELNSLITTTATPSKWWADTEIIHTLLHQGTGIINVWNAHNAGTLFDKTRLALGGTSQQVEADFTFTNTLGRSKTFEIVHEPAGLVQRVPFPDVPRDEWWVICWPSKAIYADLSFDSPTTVTLGPGESATVKFTVTPPDVETKTLPSYSGYVKLTSGRDVYRVSYFGVPYKWSDGEFIERTPALPGVNTPALVKWVEPFEELPVHGYGEFDYDKGDSVTLYFRTWQPVNEWRVDVVHHNTTFVPTIYGFDPDYQYDNLTSSNEPTVDNWGGAESVGLLFLGYRDRPASYIGLWFHSRIDPIKGELLPNPLSPGDYRLLLRAVRYGLDSSDPENWDSYLSPIMHIPNGVPA